MIREISKTSEGHTRPRMVNQCSSESASLKGIKGSLTSEGKLSAMLIYFLISKSPVQHNSLPITSEARRPVQPVGTALSLSLRLRLKVRLKWHAG